MGLAGKAGNHVGLKIGQPEMSLRNSLSPGKSLFFLVSRYPPLGSSASPLGSCRHHAIPYMPYLKPGLGHDAFMCFGHSAGQSRPQAFHHSISQLPARWSLDLSPTFLGVEPPQQAHQAFYVGFNATNSLEALIRTPRPPRVLQGSWVAPTGRCRTTTAVHQDTQSCWPILKTGPLVPFDHFSSIAWKDVESLEFYIFGGPHWLTNLDGRSSSLDYTGMLIRSIHVGIGPLNVPA